MAVIYDSSASGLQTSGVVSLTFSLTVTTGTSALVIGVGGTWPDSSKPNASGAFITYGGTKFIKTVNNVNMSGSTVLASYVSGFLMDPTPGSNDIVITMQSSVGVTWLNAITMSVSGTTGTPAFKSSSLSSTSITRSETISSQVNGVVMSFALLAGTSNSSWAVDAGSTERVASTYASPWVLKGATKTATYPSTSITWTNNGGSATRYSVLMTYSFTPKETSLSPTYYYDFQNDVAGYMPNEFTPFNDWKWGGSWAVATVPGETTEKALSLSGTTSYGMNNVYNNAIGKITYNNQPIEIATKIKVQKPSNPTQVTIFPADTPTIGFMLEASNGFGLGVSFRYGYAEEFRIMAYSDYGAEHAIAFQPHQMDGTLTFSTSSNIVTGDFDPALPYNTSWPDYPHQFVVGEYYQITSLGNTNWNTVANTTGLTYKISDILQVVNVPAYDPSCGAAMRKLKTRFKRFLNPFATGTVRTTGSVNAGSTSSTVASATGLSVGMTINIAGADYNGGLLWTSISGISGTTITLANAAQTTVSDATVYANDGTYIGAERGIAVGATLYTMDGTAIGVIQSIESTTSLTLTTNANINGTGVKAKIHPDAFVPQTNTWYYVRIRREVVEGIGSIFKAKVWPTTSIEPDLWLLDSTFEKNGYSHNIIDQYMVSGGLGATVFMNGINYYYAQIGISLDGGVASLDGTFPPSITSVDGDNIITSTQTNIPIVGYHLTGTASAAIIQGATSIPQTVTINSETSATFSIEFDTNVHDVKYGTAVLRLTSANGGIGSKTITITPPDARCYRDLTSVNTTTENRLTALPDLAVGDQIEVISVNGGSLSSVNINSDGTFDADGSVTSFTCRAWSAADQSWGITGLQAMVSAAIRRRVIIIS